jgi:pimeloyl-ACP methyl ester carboxylesterase
MHAPGFPQFRLSAVRFLLAFRGGRLLARWVMCRDPEGFAARNIHYHDPSLMSREEAREYGSIFRDRDRTEVFIRILRESLDPSAMHELEKRLLEIRKGQQVPVPTRLFWARQDVIVPPSFGLRYQKLLPAAELIWFDRASHFLQVDDPEGTVQGILRFDEQSR